jgi:hypothetical protein
MRAFLVIALAVGLTACSDWNGDFFGSGDVRQAQPAPAPAAAPEASAPAPLASAPAPVSSPAPIAASPRATSDHCRNLARQRAGDAAYAGEDEETQQSVYDRTYAGCMDWDSKHAS